MKAGGNEFHGDARGMKEWNEFQATNLPSTFPGGKTANQLQDFYDIFGDVGGRIIRDKLWFYGGIHFQRRSTSIIGYIGQNGGQGFDPLSQDNQEAKMTYQVSKNIKLIGSGSDGTKYENQRNGSNLVPFYSTFRQYDNYYTVKGEVVWTPSPKLIVDLLGGDYWQPYGYPNQLGVGVAGNPWTFSATTQQITGANINVSSSDKGEHKRAQTTGSVGYFRGKHSFQFGYMAFIPQADTKTFVNHPGGNYELQFETVNGVTTPLQIVTYNFPLYAAGKETAIGLYAKDTWRVSNRLTLNPGVRFDRYRGYHNEESEGGGPFYSSAHYSGQTDYVWKRLVPRIGAAYDLAGNGRTVIRGSYGIYNLDELGQFDIDNYNPAAITSNTYKWTGPCQVTKYTDCDVTAATLANLGSGTTTYISTTGGAGGIVNHDLKMPFMQTASATVERELRPNLAFRALYVYNREDDMFDQTFPNRPPSSYNIPYNTTYPLQDPVNGGKPITILTYPASLVCPKSTPFCPFNQNKLVTRNGNPDYFHTVEFTITRRQSDKWSALATFDLTKDHKSLFTSPIFASYQTSANPVAPYQQAFPFDRTWDWALKSFFTYNLPFKVQMGLNYQFLAGAPNYRTDQFTKVPQLGTITIPVESWGTQRNPPLNLLNFRAAKIIAIGETRSLTATLELFNALNSSPGTTINYLSGSGASTFGTVSAVLPPTIGRLGLQFKF
jgi:TonB dependent receptor